MTFMKYYFSVNLLSKDLHYILRIFEDITDIYI